ncbi:MAG: hypothetical protein KC448_00830 [Yoonia sp.]|nr:hypothetical protein [Yoonia sp.]
MNAKTRVQIDKFTSGQAIATARPIARPNALPHPLRQHINALGVMPKTSLEVFADLGLSDGDIARYFEVPLTCITKLREIWDIHC